MIDLKAHWSTHVGRAVLVALLVSFALFFFRFASGRPVSVLDMMVAGLLHETGFANILGDHVGYFVLVIGLFQLSFGAVIGAVVGLIAKIFRSTVKTAGWASAIVVGAPQLFLGFLSLAVP
jgi:hypothetical protein